jgi:hypothetical protein
VNDKIIEITCDVKDYLDVGAFTPLQGNLKTKTEDQLRKLKNQIIRYGFSFPLYVCKVGSNNFTMDGHGRDIVTHRLKEEGYRFMKPGGETGYFLPVVYVFAKDKVEAKEKLLALNSSYGTISDEGLEEFLNEKNFEIYLPEIKDDLELPGLDLNKYFEGDIESNEPEIDPFDDEGITGKNQFGVIVMCEDESSQENIFKHLTGKGYNCKIVVT